MRILYLQILTIGCLIVPNVSFAQVMDTIGDVSAPCVDIVGVDVTADSEEITATLWVDGNFCEGAQYQFHVDVDGDEDSDYGFMVQFNRQGYRVTGSSNLEVEVDESQNLITFSIPIYEFVHKGGELAETVSVWFRAHLRNNQDLYPNLNDELISLSLDNDAIKVIGSDGGVLQITDPDHKLFGSIFYVPPGALSVPTGITIRTEEATTPSPIGFISGEEQIVFGPSGLIFNEPAVMTLALDSVEDAIYYLYNDEFQYWERLYSTKNTITNTLSIEVPHFSFARWHCWNKTERGDCQMFDLDSNVTWKITKAGSNVYVDDLTVQQEINDAFSVWESALNDRLNFVYVNSGPAEIEFEWTSEVPIGNTAQHLFNWQVLTLDGQHVIRFADNGEEPTWGKYRDETVFPPMWRIFTKATHEIGHALGSRHLCYQAHNDDCQAFSDGPLMAHRIKRPDTFDVTGLEPLDISNIQRIYGLIEPTYFSDNFESYSVGERPTTNSPDIGSYFQIGGDIQVVNDSGNQILVLNDQSTTDGAVIVAGDYTGISGKYMIEADFKIQIDSPTTFFNDFIIQLIFGPLGNNYNLEFGWLDWVIQRESRNGVGTFPVLLNANILENAWNNLRFIVDTDSNTLTLFLNSDLIFSNQQILGNIDSLLAVAFSTNFAVKGKFFLDNLEVRIVP